MNSSKQHQAGFHFLGLCTSCGYGMSESEAKTLGRTRRTELNHYYGLAIDDDLEPQLHFKH